MICFIGNFYFSIGYSRDKRKLRDHLIHIANQTNEKPGGNVE